MNVVDNLTLSVEYDDGVPDGPKQKPSGPRVTRRGRECGFYIVLSTTKQNLRIPVGYMRVSEMKPMEELCRNLLTSCADKSSSSSNAMSSSPATDSIKSTPKPIDPASSVTPNRTERHTSCFKTVRQSLGRKLQTLKHADSIFGWWK
jgi:hypothetical protein